MIRTLIFFLSGKSLVLYENHRQVQPLVNDINRKQYFFLSVNFIWNLARIFRHSKFSFRFASFMLTLTNPDIIVSKNWVIRRDLVYYLWAKKYKKKFIVVQHGAYVGGVVSLYDHRFARCTLFYTWGCHYQNLFNEYNKQNNYTTLLEFGNPVYNGVNRNLISYKQEFGSKVLFVHSTRNQFVIDEFDKFAAELIKLGFDVTYKSHPKQFRLTKASAIKSVGGELYDILQTDDFDIVVSNHSTSLLDAICFKKPVLFFDPEKKNTVYSGFLSNLYTYDLINISKDDFKKLINIPGQEDLYNKLVTKGNNQIRF